MNKPIVQSVLLAAAVMNIGGVLLFSKCFTNTAINDADPMVMSNFGLVMIAVWGLAYAGASAIRCNIPWLLAVFAIEKSVYLVMWVKWLASNSLWDLFEIDAVAGIFYGIYGLNDLIFALLFLWGCVSQLRQVD